MGRLTGVLLLSLLLAVAAAAPEAEVQSSYIVHVAPGHAPRSSRPRLLSRAYTSFILDQLPTHLQQPDPRVHYSYAHAATGFAARLTGRQADHLASLPSVLAVIPDVMHQLHTTQTPSFLQLSDPDGLLPASKAAPDIVIGVIDTGVYPKDRASFVADPSLPPPPRTFRGRCVSTPEFNASAYCNNKLVGANFFRRGYEALNGGPIHETESQSPLDTNGHGTHTASTAAGSAVEDAAFFGYGKGTAVGMAPRARIAAYKACWAEGCAGSDILMAFEEAIKDGVNVISVSISADGEVAEFHSDNTAVGAFKAVSKGIVVSASAGNSGPGEFTAVNVAPWILTVGASTINRQFPANLVLGNSETFTGTSLYAGTPLGPSKIPLVYGGDVGSSVCEADKLIPRKVAGKIVVCDPGVIGPAAKGEAIKLAGGAGAILVSNKAFGEQAITSPHILPATAVTFAAAEEIKKYIGTTASPVATIVFPGTVIGRTPSSPRMASFSSRGPNLRAPEILKPDITAPGVDIMAAWTGENSPSELDSDTRRVKFNIMSGTSMSCPHVSSIAAMLRQVYPDWSPAAIKSALMTTAYNVDNAGDVIKDMSTGQASTPFVRGSGHVDPNSALKPGLVYDAGADDYVSFLCALGYTAEQIAIFTERTECSKRKASVGDLNYPSFSVVFNSDKKPVRQRRVVREVGSCSPLLLAGLAYKPWTESTVDWFSIREKYYWLAHKPNEIHTVTCCRIGCRYRVRVTSPAGVKVTVTPDTLRFGPRKRTQKYEVIFTPVEGMNVTEKYTFGSIEWSDGEHKVTSPIAVTWPVTQQSQAVAKM